MKLSAIQTVDDFHKLARRRAPRIISDFIDGGASYEEALVESTEQYGRFRLHPRYMVDVATRVQNARLMGRTYDLPFGIGPTGYAGLCRRGAERSLAEAAAAANIPVILSSVSVASMEEIAPLAGKNLWFQLYAAGEDAINYDLLDRAASLGIETLVVTVDVVAPALRYRKTPNQFKIPARLTPSLVWDVLGHPRWLVDYWRMGGLPYPGNWRKYAKPAASPLEVMELMRKNAFTSVTWERMRDYRARWKGNFVIKGILDLDDARMAGEIGADGIIVSNHGGRQFNRAPCVTSVLPEIVEAVGDRLAVMADGGIRTGADVLIAHRLGAQFVFLGRATLWGVIAAGRPGVDRVVDILRHEIDNALAQLGVADLPSLSRIRLTEA